MNDQIKWANIALFYLLACGLTYLLIQFPNVIREVWVRLFDLKVPFNWNHGIGLLLASILAYRLFKTERRTTLFGNRPLASLLFSSIFLIAYTIVGFTNNLGVNPHLWAFITCLSTLIYDLFEESAWRGFLNDKLSTTPFWLKGIITGILWGFWHLLIFDSFDQFGGLHIFVLLCIIVSIIMAYATDKTNSLLVAA
ncbi:CAAX protease self-immunity, partial [Parapedobacter luteus]